MRNLLLLIAIVVLSVTVVPLGGADSVFTGTRRFQRLPPAPQGRVVFDSDYGVVSLHFNGTEVTGSYSHRGGGTLQGKLEGHKFIGTWHEPNTNKEPKSGQIILKFAKDWDEFRGWYTTDGDPVQRKDEWNGIKVETL